MILVYVHLPRTAGANLGAVLQKYFKAPCMQYGIERFGEPNTLNNPGETHFIELARCIREVEKKHENIYIQGHIPYGIHRYIESPVKYITIVRNPIKRVWSRYNAYRSAQQYSIYQYWKREYDLKFERIIEAGELELCNDQTRLIIGTCRKEITDFDATVAIDLLVNKYTWVGTTEDFWKSGSDFSKAVGIPNVKFNRARVNRVPFTIGHSPSLVQKELILKYNSQDQKIYEFVCKHRLELISSAPTIPPSPLVLKVDLNSLMKNK